jgi:hypothetical protein
MTSSARSTSPARPADRTAAWTERLSVPLVVLFGWLIVLNAYNWRITPSAVMLWLGWLATVVAAKLMWRSFWSLAMDSDEDEVPLAEVDESRRGDLIREKKSLLRSIKDVEFDRDMGKMSAAEAGEILRVYRARAIEIIKELEDTALDDASLTVEEAVEKELAARLGGRATAHVRRAAERGAAYDAEMERIEELERKDVHLYRIGGGLFLCVAGLFITLATYSAAQGGGMYVVWYGPIVAGFATAAKGIAGLIDYNRSQAAKSAGPAKPPEPEKRTKS